MLVQPLVDSSVFCSGRSLRLDVGEGGVIIGGDAHQPIYVACLELTSTPYISFTALCLLRPNHLFILKGSGWVLVIFSAMHNSAQFYISGNNDVLRMEHANLGSGLAGARWECDKFQTFRNAMLTAIWLRRSAGDLPSRVLAPASLQHA